MPAISGRSPPAWPHLTLITSLKALCPCPVTFWGAGVGSWTYALVGTDQCITEGVLKMIQSTWDIPRDTTDSHQRVGISAYFFKKEPFINLSTQSVSNIVPWQCKLMFVPGGSCCSRVPGCLSWRTFTAMSTRMTLVWVEARNQARSSELHNPGET